MTVLDANLIQSLFLLNSRGGFMKIKKKPAAGLLLMAMIMLLTACSTAAYKDTYGDFSYAYRNLKGNGYIYSYAWDGSADKMDIYIPDKINDVKITGLGGYYGRGLPMQFEIALPDEYRDFEIPEGWEYRFYVDEHFVTDQDYESFTFNIYIGTNVKEYNLFSDTCYYVGMEEESSENQDILYKVEYNFIIDEKNRYLEVVDGKLVKKER